MTYAHENDVAGDAVRKADVAAFLKAAIDEPDGDAGGDEALKSNEPRFAARPEAKECASAKAQPDSYTNPAGKASENAPSGISVTVFTNEGDALAKRISLGPKGDLVKATAANMSEGWARVMPAGTASALAAIINGCQTTQALCYATPKHASDADIRVVVKGRETNRAISRSKDYFTFSDGPGWGLFDADGTGDVDVFGIICSVLPGLVAAAHVRRMSTSYGLTDVFGREFPYSGGQHISPLLKKQSDTPRFLEALHRRLWLAGHGFVTVGKNGALYTKSPIDTSVWLASNHDSAAHVEEADARYLILDVSPCRKGDTDYFTALVAQIKNGGAEAFAHYLLTRDVSNFTPWRDLKKDNAAKRAMIRESRNPFDACVWIKESAALGEVLGSGREWIEREEWPFAGLYRAYVDWQKTVHTRAAPQPTPANRFGEVLGKAGFKERRKASARLRVMPSREVILGGEA